MREFSFNGLYKFFSRLTTGFIDKAKLTEHTFMIVIAIIIGILSGFAAIGIRAMIKAISYLSFPGNGNILQNILSNPWYVILLAPILGGLVVGPIIYFFAQEAKGHGVPEVMQAILLQGGKIRPRVAFIKAIASAISIGSGGSVGREGPIIQIGSSLGSTIGQFFKVPGNRLKTLVGCGSAAGIAAAFNAPIAGALFAVEIILMDFAVAQFSPIVISSVMATVISHNFEGDFAAFQVPKYYLNSPYEIIFYFILGAGCGVVSFLFIKLLYLSEDFFDNKFHFPEYLKSGVGGVGIGIIALIFPQIMGVGYDSINIALQGNMIWYLAFALIFVKIIATSLTLGSGGSGGIFAPSLFMGAMLGLFFGSIMHNIFPAITARPGAYALVAMGGLVAGTTRAPITAIIIVFELTNDYKIILPLMVTCIISVIISSRLSRESIYTLKLLLRNIGIREGVETNIMESIFVKDVYTKDYDWINTADSFNQTVNKVIHGRNSEFPLVNGNREIIGIISLNNIRDFLLEKDILQNVLIAEDVANKNFDVVSEEDNCRTALDKMSKYDLTGLPVTESNGSQKLKGMLWRKDILEAYQKEIERRELTVSLASSIVMKDDETKVHFMEGYSISEISPPKSFINKSIRELNIRARWGVDVLSVKVKDKNGFKLKAIPNPDYIFKKEDTMIIAGEIRNINLLKAVE